MTALSEINRREYFFNGEKMESTTVYIKNMVCPRCVMAVSNIVSESGYHLRDIMLGKVEVTENLTHQQIKELDSKLRKLGFEVLKSRETQLTEQIKTFLIGQLDLMDETDNSKKISVLLSEHLHIEYSQLSKMFSHEEGITIEKFFIRLKIEKAKELISYHNLTLSEIAFKLKYSSLQHLSSQFKQITGMSVSDYKKMSEHDRKPLTHLH
jgi:AraC family transcriptional regulator